MEALTARSPLVGGSVGGFVLPFCFPSRGKSVRGRPAFLPILRASSKDGPELDKWDQMELKFGRLLGEDPKLTLAKIMARKSNPDVSYLDVEKSFRKNKVKLDDYMINIPSDVRVEEVNPVPPKRVDVSKHKDAQNVKEGKIHLSRPTMNKGISAMKSTEKSIYIQTSPNQSISSSTDKSEIPNISLRKPSITQDDDIDMNSKLKIQSNLFLKMRKKSSEDLSNVSLLKKPEVVKISLDPQQESVSPGDSFLSSPTQMGTPVGDAKILNEGKMFSNDTDLIKPAVNLDEFQLTSSDESSNTSTLVENDMVEDYLDDNDDVNSTSSKLDDGPVAGLQPPNKGVTEAYVTESSSTHLDHSPNSMTSQASLLGKPQRLEASTKGTSQLSKGKKVSLPHDDHTFSTGTEAVISADQKEIEENDWKKAEHLLHSGGKAEVELISCSSRGFFASLGSLIGFLPYRKLGNKWKFFAFESWLRKKGVDPLLYRQNLSILGSYDACNKDLDLESTISQELKQNTEVLQSNLEYEQLLEAYDKEKNKFLSSFIGQRLKACVIMADRNSRKIMFSGRPKEKEEVVEKKRNLMGRLSIGDVVKCSIKKFTFFGIFVEVEGVPALIHQTEVSWDATSDPSSYYKIGRMVEAKVHQLDYNLERILLSLRDVMPHRLEPLESVLGDQASLDGKLEAMQADVEWPEVDSLMEELQKIDGVSCVSRGRFFRSPGLAPTFQVYMASMFDNKYKLLARYENKVQEVMVVASLDKERLKAAIVTCTSKVT